MKSGMRQRSCTGSGFHCRGEMASTIPGALGKGALLQQNNTTDHDSERQAAP